MYYCCDVCLGFWVVLDLEGLVWIFLEENVSVCNVVIRLVVIVGLVRYVWKLVLIVCV